MISISLTPVLPAFHAQVHPKSSPTAIQPTHTAAMVATTPLTMATALNTEPRQFSLSRASFRDNRMSGEIVEITAASSSKWVIFATVNTEAM
jgi:predicted HAD superfamily Cof-like phosphohydrolase